MATEIKFDPVKAATASSLIKQGFSEEEAFQRAGISEEAFGVYQIDDVPGSPTRGQVTKGFDAVVMDASEKKAFEQKLAAEEAAKQARLNEISKERERQRQEDIARRAKEKEEAKQAWVDEEEKAQNAGPADTRTTSEVVTTGGAERITKMTPEMEDYVTRSNAAYKADQAATAAAQQEYLRSKGLDQASPAAKRAALREAEKSGTTFASTANRDALGEPPARQYTEEVIQPNRSGNQIPNDGSRSNEQAAKNSAGGQTADSSSLESEELSDSEADKVTAANNGQLDSDLETSKEGSATDTNQSAADDEATSSQNASVVGDSGVSGNESPSVVFATATLYNKLHDYASYTYRITLFLLTKEDYNKLSSSVNTFEPSYALISSGGGYSTGSSPFIDVSADEKTIISHQSRHPDFLDDFFIDNLNFTTVVGLNSKTKASNSLEISFNVFEPHGLSLLDRLLSACEVTAKCANYLEQPYLLQIDFLASPTDPMYDGIQEKSRLIDRKRMAIKLMSLKINPEAGGTNYQLTAIPFNHTAFSLTTAAVPVPFNIEADTVGKFFSTKEDAVKLFQQEIKSNEERIESELEKWKATTQATSDVQIEQQRNAIRSSLQYNSRSFTAAYNEYMQDLHKKQKLSKLPPTLIAFNFTSDEIANSSIIDEESSQAADTRLIDRDQGVNTVDPQYKQMQTFQINAGTNIVDVIDRVMKKSSYIRNQITDNAKYVEEQQEQENYDTTKRTTKTNKNIFLNWYKIIPTVVLNDFDNSRNAYSKTILYSVLPYKTANFYHPSFPKTTSPGDEYIRQYDYLYTGKNRDIIKVDISFDNTFYTQITSYRDQVKRGGDNRNNEVVDIEEDRFAVQATENEITNPPVTTHIVGHNSDAKTMNTATSPTDQIIADLSKSLYTSAKGDMLNISLHIIGDPAFIKQDDVYFNPGNPKEWKDFNITAGDGRPINKDTGQILFDRQQIYVKLQFLNVVDIDDKIGIVNRQTRLSNGRMTNGSFSGIYRVLKVKNSFLRGKFEQVLELIKVPEKIPSKPAEEKSTVQVYAVPEPEFEIRDLTSEELNGAPIEQAAGPELVDIGNQAGETVQQASDITQENPRPQTFAEAFRQARKDFGNKPGGQFEWRGKMYQTNLSNEPYVTNPVNVY